MGRRMWYAMILLAVMSTGNSRYIDDDRSEGSYLYERKRLNAFADGVQSLSRNFELPKLPLITVKDSDDILPNEMAAINVKRPLFDELGTIVTYPDKQLLDINDEEGRLMQESDSLQRPQGKIRRPRPDCIPRSEQYEITSDSAEETVMKEAADELLSPVDDGLETNQHSSNFTGPEIIEEPFILVTIRPLCPY